MMQEYGLSGFLAPDGTFHSCDYMKHQELAEKLVKEYGIEFQDSNKVDGFLKFGCAPWVKKEGNGMCHVFGNSMLTKQQIDWIEKTNHRMTDVQRRQVLQLLHVYGEEIEE